MTYTLVSLDRLLDDAVLAALDDLEPVSPHLFHVLSALEEMPAVQECLDFSDNSLGISDQLLLSLRRLACYERIEFRLEITELRKI